MAAPSSPTYKGVYINSLKINTSDYSPFTHLLGADGYGNITTPTGTINKLDMLFSWMQFYGYNYAILYDTSGVDFVGAPSPTAINPTANPDGASAEVFTPEGKQRLRALIDKARSYGIDYIGVVCDLFKPNYTHNRYDGTSQIRKIYEYHNDGVTTTAQRIDVINIETEFWNFGNYTKGTDIVAGSSVYKYKYGATPNKLVTFSGSGSCPVSGVANFTTMFSLNDFVQVYNPSNTPSYRYRQIVNITANTITLDRDLPASPGIDSNSCNWVEIIPIGGTSGTIDYQTYYERCGFIRAFITANSSTFKDSHGSTIYTEAYIGFPDDDAEAGPFQLRNIAQYIDRILLTDYTPIPNYGYLDGTYRHGSTRRLTGDLALSPGHNLGCILSAESATFNNAKCSGTNFAPPGYATDFNFSGYFLEGRSNAGASSGGTVNTARPENVSTGPRIAIPPTVGSPPVPVSYDTCAGSSAPTYPGGLQAPPINITPKSLQDCWDYITKNPGPGGTPAYSSPTFNEKIAAGGTDGTNLDTHLTFDTIVIFDQEFIRQLTITPPLTITGTATGTNPSCNGLSDGTVTATPTGGTGPYTYLWDDPGTSTTATVTGLPSGTYSCIITDATTATVTVSVTLTDPSDVAFSVSSTSIACNATTGTITASNVTGGPSTTYYYSCVLTGNPNSFGSGTTATSHTFTGLPAGNYTVAVMSGTCITTHTKTVSSLSAGTISLSSTAVSCHNGNDGTITASMTGGNSPFTYTVTLGSTTIASNGTGNFTGLAANTYTVVSVDSAGCTDSDIVTVVNKAVPTIYGVGNRPSCIGGSDGRVDIFFNMDGGSVFTYHLGSTSQSSGIFTGLTPGFYDGWVTNDLGCSTPHVLVQVPDGNVPTAVYIVTDVEEGSTTGGSIVLDYIDATFPVSYFWSNGANTDSITDLVPGVYTVSIVDDNGCTNVYSFTIKTKCKEFSYDYFLNEIEKAKCCFADLSELVVNYMRIGDKKRLMCILPKFRLMSMYIKRLENITNPGADECAGCEGLASVLENIREICNCTDCEELTKLN